MARGRKLPGLFVFPSPSPLFFVSVDFKGFDVSSKSFRINTCGDFSEVFILKGLRGQKNR